jgi:uncharacterized protein YbjQ (UPF0145 family)
MTNSNICPRCNSWLIADGTCASCPGDSALQAHEEIIEHSKKLPVFTTHQPKSLEGFIEVGLVFGTSSKLAFWGLSKQSDRLERAYEAALANLKYEAALLEADAIVGVTFALNNSTGSSAVLGGSSEAVMLLGTAVKRSKK